MTFTDQVIENVVRREPTALRVACERNLFVGTDGELGNTHEVMKELENLSIDEALMQTLQVLCHRALLFSRHFDEITRMRLLEDICELATKAPQKTQKFKGVYLKLSKAQLTVVNHMIEAYTKYIHASDYKLINHEITRWRLLYCLQSAFAGQERFSKASPEDNKRKALKARLAHRSKYLAAHHKTADLLVELRPPEGWASEVIAARTILEPLKKFLTEEKIRHPSKESDAALLTTLRRWMRKEYMINFIYMQNSK
jgi:hypothetical protein